MKYLLNIIQPENNLTEKLTVSLQNTQMLTLMHSEWKNKLAKWTIVGIPKF
jgi:hypothetical protein